MATIGIFDSGSGGLSVFREIYKLLPDQKYIYFSDNANCPYGEKTHEFIRQRSHEITDFLLGKGADIIVIACNTATGASIASLRKDYSNRFIGMEPAVKPAALATRTGIIGVLATAGTLSGAKYLLNKEKYEDDIRIVERTGKNWVELVERGILTGPEAEETVKASLQPLLDEGADNIVLGCTHYPFLMETIQKIAGPDITIIDPAPCVARYLVQVLISEKLLDPDYEVPGPEKENAGILQNPDIELISSGDIEPLKRIFRLICPTYKG